MSQDKKDRQYQIVVWGATGFTGNLVVQYIARRQYEAKLRANAPQNGDQEWTSLKWAIAGRAKDKLEKAKAAAQSEVSGDLKAEVPVNADMELADSGDQASIEALVKKTRVIISTVGPFLLYGSGLVKACADAGVHYTDSTGEFLWVKQMIAEVNAKAEQTNTLIVPMCGFDSIPADISAYLAATRLKQKFGGLQRVSVRSVVKMSGGGVSGGTAHTLMSMFDALGKVNAAVRKDMFNPHILVPEPEQPKADKSEFDAPYPMKVADGAGPGKAVWTAPFIMSAANGAVVRRSSYLHKQRGEPYAEQSFVYTSERLALPNFFAALIGVVLMAVGMLLVALGPVRSLLKKYVLPAQGTGPSKEARTKARFLYCAVADGVAPAASAGGDPRPVHAVATVAGGDAGYTQTAMMCAESAMSLAFNRNQLPAKTGGVLTPAAAFGEVLVERLSRPGNFQIEVVANLKGEPLSVAQPVSKKAQ